MATQSLSFGIISDYASEFAQLEIDWNVLAGNGLWKWPNVPCSVWKTEMPEHRTWNRTEQNLAQKQPSMVMSLMENHNSHNSRSNCDYIKVCNKPWLRAECVCRGIRVETHRTDLCSGLPNFLEQETDCIAEGFSCTNHASKGLKLFSANRGKVNQISSTGQ